MKLGGSEWIHIVAVAVRIIVIHIIVIVIRLTRSHIIIHAHLMVVNYIIIIVVVAHIAIFLEMLSSLTILF